MRYCLDYNSKQGGLCILDEWKEEYVKIAVPQQEAEAEKIVEAMNRISKTQCPFS